MKKPARRRLSGRLKLKTTEKSAHHTDQRTVTACGRYPSGFSPGGVCKHCKQHGLRRSNVKQNVTFAPPPISRGLWNPQKAQLHNSPPTLGERVHFWSLSALTSTYMALCECRGCPGSSAGVHGRPSLSRTEPRGTGEDPSWSIGLAQHKHRMRRPKRWNTQLHQLAMKNDTYVTPVFSSLRNPELVTNNSELTTPCSAWAYSHAVGYARTFRGVRATLFHWHANASRCLLSTKSLPAFTVFSERGSPDCLIRVHTSCCVSPATGLPFTSMRISSPCTFPER